MYSKAAVMILSLALLPYASLAAEPDKPAADGDKIVCKRYSEVGSLVRQRKVCLTKAEWQRERRGARDATREMQEDNMRMAPQG